MVHGVSGCVGDERVVLLKRISLGSEPHSFDESVSSRKQMARQMGFFCGGISRALRVIPDGCELFIPEFALGIPEIIGGRVRRVKK
jgi:hypothetical protein